MSLIASTTRNLDHASHPQNNVVFAPSIVGPSPKSYCNHIPGSVTHGRCTRTRPTTYAAFTTATARRLVRSEPVNPSPTSLRCATSARILPVDASTHSSILGR